MLEFFTVSLLWKNFGGTLVEKYEVRGREICQQMQKWDSRAGLGKDGALRSVSGILLIGRAG